MVPSLILFATISIIVLDRMALLNAPSYTKQGLSAFESGNYVESIHKFSQAQKHSETDILTRRMLGMSYHNYGWHDEALIQYEATWFLAQNNAALAMRNAGRLHRIRNEPEKALTCFHRAVAVDPEFAGAWADLAELHRVEGRPKPALSAIDRAIKLEPQDLSFQQIRASIRTADERPTAETQKQKD
ncbi:MAG: tetratricopeptide repeat protein [Gammaproteobacteria bacterium]|nr:tetratricopeptide repeat protein [Gammaproteobacteria bacterium]